MRTDLCFDCEHYYWNNRDTYKDGYRGGTCRAYPEGRPYGYPKDGHKEVQDNQVGDFVYKKCEPDMKNIAERDIELGDIRVKEYEQGLY